MLQPSAVFTAALAALFLSASPSRAQESPAHQAAVLIADASGLIVRLPSADARTAARLANPCGAAVNTAGVARATVAVVHEGRVYLSARPPVASPAAGLAALPARTLVAALARALDAAVPTGL